MLLLTQMSLGLRMSVLLDRIVPSRHVSQDNASAVTSVQQEHRHRQCVGAEPIAGMDRQQKHLVKAGTHAHVVRAAQYDAAAATSAR